MKYKSITYLLLCIAMPLISLGQADVKALFAKGNQQYAGGHYKEALASYKQVLDAGYTSAPLYFNIGNAYYKTDEISSALLYYEKARHLSPADDDINFNIRYAYLKTTDKIEEVPEFFLSKCWHNFILCCSLGVLTWLSIALVLLASLVLICYLFTNSVTVKKLSFFTSLILFFLGLVTIFMGNRQAAYFDNHKQALIFSGSVTVKSTPAAAAKTLFLLHEGTKVDVLETNAGKIRIKLANGTEGWIGAGDVREI
jgi:tetratricopeptide (TPR) repeat protein